MFSHEISNVYIFWQHLRSSAIYSYNFYKNIFKFMSIHLHIGEVELRKNTCSGMCRSKNKTIVNLCGFCSECCLLQTKLLNLYIKRAMASRREQAADSNTEDTSSGYQMG